MLQSDQSVGFGGFFRISSKANFRGEEWVRKEKRGKRREREGKGKGREGREGVLHP
jgi:hypothetical protein